MHTHVNYKNTWTWIHGQRAYPYLHRHIDMDTSPKPYIYLHRHRHRHTDASRTCSWQQTEVSAKDKRKSKRKAIPHGAKRHPFAVADAPPHPQERHRAGNRPRAPSEGANTDARGGWDGGGGGRKMGWWCSRPIRGTERRVRAGGGSERG